MPPILWKRTFADYKKLMKQVKDLGMDDVDMCIVGWNYLGFDGPFPKLWPVPEELGGEAGMKDAIAYGKSLGYRMSVHVNNHNIYRRAAAPAGTRTTSASTRRGTCAPTATSRAGSPTTRASRSSTTAGSTKTSRT